MFLHSLSLELVLISEMALRKAIWETLKLSGQAPALLLGLKKKLKTEVD